MSALLKGSVMGLGPVALNKRGTNVRVCAVKQEVRSQQASSGKAEEIYIGFPKNDYAPRAGRKGRVIRDDPRKYPGREDMGPLSGVVGGWAGGEVGLWQLRDAVKLEEEQRSASAGSGTTRGLASNVRQPTKSKWGIKTSSAGKDPIYVGFGKDELDLKKTGIQGRVIYDEAYKYPDREDMGPLRGVVGGFAGGEAALRKFVETGELKLRKPGDRTPVKRQFSPLTLAFFIIFAAAGGGILLTTAFDLGDAGVQEIVQVTAK